VCGVASWDDVAEVQVTPSVDLSDADQALEHFDASLESLRVLAEAGRIFDAYHALQVLEKEVGVASRQCAQKVDAIRAFGERLRSDSVLAKLRGRYADLQESLSLLSVTKCPDTTWFDVEAAEPRAGPHTRAHVTGRWLKGSERDPKGPSSQAVLVTKLSNVPLSIDQFVCLIMETDLMRPEFFQDIKSVQGAPGSKDNLYNAYHHMITVPSLFPLLKLCGDSLVGFTVCTKPPEPLKHLGPGVLINLRAVPAGVKHYKGFDIVSKPARAIRLEVGTFHYCSWSSEVEGTMDITTYSTAGAPLPQSMFPLHVASKLILGMARGNLIRWREKVAEHLNKNERYAARIAASPEFYGAISRTRPESHAQPCPAESPCECDDDIMAI
jgi:cell fate (sporulation/competence/biofilm development) regulator YlbF (YheA/YmcA/DUF963 family)